MKNSKGNLLIWLVISLLGFFLIFGHNLAQDLICKVIAIGLLIAAVAGIALWWKDRESRKRNIAKLLGSVAFIVLGVWILSDTAAFLTFFNVAIGFVMIVSGAISVYQGWKEGKDKLAIIFGAAGIVLGLVIACNNAATTWVVILEGIGLVYTGVTGLLSERRR